jgi:SAM-dependent methyltransferase
VTALAESAARIDREERRSLLRTSVEEIVERALAAASDLVAREVRKGRRPAASLDTFARRYGTVADARNYRDRRFARSRHGRKVDAAERRIVEQLLRDLGVTGPVLDAPCGAGRFLPILAAGGRAVTGADAAPEMIRLARQQSQELGLGCALAAADARRLPAPDGTFELVLSMRLLHRIPGRAERAEVLKELARVSRKWVLFSFYNRRSWRGLREQLRGRYAGETERTIAHEAAEAGLRADRFIRIGLGGRQTLVICRVQ